MQLYTHVKRKCRLFIGMAKAVILSKIPFSNAVKNSKTVPGQFCNPAPPAPKGEHPPAVFRSETVGGCSPLGADRSFKTLHYWYFINIALASLLIVLIVNISSQQTNNHPIPKVETTHSDKSSIYFGNSAEGQQLSKEALLWLTVLKSYKEKTLTHEELMQKFKNMSTAYAILSSTSGGDVGRRYWSAEAVKYGKLSAGVIEGMMVQKNVFEQSEVNTRLTIAMGLNYYVGGTISRKEIQNQFKKIPSSFLIRSGFCNNRILLALHEDHIIRLPSLEI